MVADQFSRLLRRRAHERRDREGLIEAAPAAAADTVGVAVRGYSEAPRSETVLFNLLGGFLGSFAVVRLSTWGIRDNWGPFRNVSIGGRHIHHFVPGILLAFASGTAALLTEDDDFEDHLAVPMGAGIGPDLRRGGAPARPPRRLLDPRRPAQRPAQPRRHGDPQLAILTQRMLRRGERQQEQEGLIPSVGGDLSPAPAA